MMPSFDSFSTEIRYRDLEASYTKLLVEAGEPDRHDPEVLLFKCQELASLHNALTYINRLPEELLLMIFEEAVHWDTPIIHDHIVNGKPYYTKLIITEESISHTCDRWRTLAVNSPTLWTRVFLVSRDWLSAGLVYHHYFHLSRSQDQPIEVILDQELTKGTPFLPFGLEVVNWAHRCTSVICSYISNHSIPTNFISELSSLIRPQPSAQRPDGRFPSNFFWHASRLFPNLRNVGAASLHLSETSESWFAAVPEITDTDTQLPNLTSLNLRFIDGDPWDLLRFRRFLHVAPSLTSLSLSQFLYRQVGFHAPGTLFFPSLQKLVLLPSTGMKCVPCLGISNFVRLTRAPNLRHFEFVSPPGSTSKAIIQCVQLMELHINDALKFPLVRSLCFLNTTPSCCAMAKLWIGVFPFVSELYIAPQDAEGFSEALGISVPGFYREGPAVWPNLRRIAFVSPDSDGPWDIPIFRSKYPPSIDCILSR